MPSSSKSVEIESTISSEITPISTNVNSEASANFTWDQPNQADEVAKPNPGDKSGTTGHSEENVNSNEKDETSQGATTQHQ